MSLREGSSRSSSVATTGSRGGRVKLHQAVEGEKFGGVGPGVSPRQALELGLKVDMEAVPKNVATAIKAGKVDLNDPANTLLLLKANAVVGVTGFFNQDGGRRVIGRPRLPGESQICLMLAKPLARSGPTVGKHCRDRFWLAGTQCNSIN
jgi:hypothetical protein